MASSSSSSSLLIPASSSQSWNHEVFLSFRGEDTRKNFVGHLYAALVQKGIQTYKDDETLARGESIGPALLKAIRESRIAVIVFSKNYADSSWCLDELAYIIECMDRRGQIVMPVFYYIDPSDVRKLNGKFKEAFAKHELEHKHKVESWKRALKKFGNLSGWVTKDFANGHEASCIKDIVSSISGRLSPLNTNANKDLVGIETRLQDLKSKMELGSGGVRMVGIWGVGGGGKTTLVSAAYTEISHQFEAHCLLENIRDESRKHGLKWVQEKLLSFVLETEVVLESEREGRIMIKRRLCHKSVLLVLDDVDDLKQLEVLAGSHDWFGEGSRIIITTRDDHILTGKADMIYDVSLLSHDESIELFSRRAYREDKPVEDYELLSLDVVRYAGGLPLALEVLGSFLSDKDKDQWLSALARLKDIPDGKVMERLKISYDGLKRDEQELFLDIACFMRGWEKDEAMMVLDAYSFYPHISVKVLEQKSLIKVSNGRFDMHDLIEEMAHYIVRGEHPKNPQRHSRIWQEKDILEFCTMESTMLMENEVLALPSYTSTNPRLPPVDANVYELFKYTFSSLKSYVGHPRLPDVVANMKKLRWICWEGYPASSFPTNFQPTKLGCLMLINGRQKQLWQGCKDLPNLKIIDLRYSMNLKRTPDFSGLPNLERLILEGCQSLKEIHPSIGYHERLVYVNMKLCVDLKTFPPIIRMKKLETLELSFCFRLKMFPDIRTNMDRLVNFHLSGTSIEIVPASVGQFCTNLVSFDLTGCEKLKRIECNFRLFKHLRTLHIFGDGLKILTEDLFDKECCLEILSLSTNVPPSVVSFKNLMNRIGLQSFHQDNPLSLKFTQFPRFLRKLNLSSCNLGDGDIPSNISELSNLQVLDLSGNNFSRLDSSLSRIPDLKFLSLSYCQSLVRLPDLPSSIAILKANRCGSLESVGDQLSNYKSLWKVSLCRWNNFINGETQMILHSMLQVSAVEDRFMSVKLPPRILRKKPYPPTFTLQLPHNWYSDFSGFLVFTEHRLSQEPCVIVINQEMTSTDSQPDHYHWEAFDKNQESYEYEQVAYVPFCSLSHAAWWNSTYTNITFQTGTADSKVLLVPKKSKSGDSREKATTYCSELWEEEKDGSRKTFEIIDHSNSSKIKIVWSHIITFNVRS